MKYQGKIEWFGGNQAALDVFRMFVSLAHTWDDLVDKDKPLNEERINQAFLTALVYLPSNPFYRQIQDAIMPFWLMVVSAYETANTFEREKDPHGIEIGHTLRYAAGHIMAYAVNVCVGPEKAREYLPEIWKTIVAERFDIYREEHLNDSK